MGSFEAVAHLLLVGRLPTGSELRTFSDRLVKDRQLPDAVLQVDWDLAPWTASDGRCEPVYHPGMSDPDAQDGSPEGTFVNRSDSGPSPCLVADSHRIMAGPLPSHETIPAGLRNICCVSSSGRYEATLATPWYRR